MVIKGMAHHTHDRPIREVTGQHHRPPGETIRSRRSRHHNMSVNSRHRHTGHVTANTPSQHDITTHSGHRVTSRHQIPVKMISPPGLRSPRREDEESAREREREGGWSLLSIIHHNIFKTIVNTPLNNQNIATSTA